MRCCAAEMAPHRTPPLPPRIQQPKTAGANSKLDKTWGQGHSIMRRRRRPRRQPRTRQRSSDKFNLYAPAAIRQPHHSNTAVVIYTNVAAAVLSYVDTQYGNLHGSASSLQENDIILDVVGTTGHPITSRKTSDSQNFYQIFRDVVPAS